METILGVGRHHYVKVVGILLILAVLTGGIVGCGGEGAVQCDLTIASTEGGSVVAPGEGSFTYNRTAVVSLLAEPDDGYQFIKWTGNVGTISDVNAASTNIRMSSTYSITAIFAKEIVDWYGLNGNRDNLGGNYVLTNDLDSATPGYEELVSRTAKGGQGWQPVGTEDRPFTGTLYGQGHKIRNLFIDRPEGNHIGLFGFVGRAGAIENVGLVNPTVTGNEYVGALVGRNFDGVVTNCYSAGSAGSVKGYIRVGGLVGWNQDTVSTSYSTLHVGYARSVGGLVGYNTGTVSNSYSSGSVIGFQYVGGLVGTIHVGGGVNNCYSSTSVTYEVPPKGGLIGCNYMFVGGVKASFWDIQTSRQHDSAGGTGKNTTGMKDINIFLSAGWNITAVANPDTRDPSSIWNIVNGESYPFLSWQPVS